MKRLLLALLLAWGVPAWADIDAHQFETPEQEAAYKTLVQELRCLVCQNQNLADSNAELAVDLRRQVYEMLMAGKSQQEIADYMVARYGDFVLYRPPVTPATYMLWFAPALLFVVGSVALFIFVRRRGAAQGESATLSEEEQRRLAELLDDNNGEPRQ